MNSGIRRQLSKYLNHITIGHGGMNCSTSALRRRGASANTLVGVVGVETLHMGLLLFTLADLTSVPPGDSLRVASLGPPASVSNCDFVATPMLKRAYQVKGGCEEAYNPQGETVQPGCYMAVYRLPRVQCCATFAIPTNMRPELLILQDLGSRSSQLSSYTHPAGSPTRCTFHEEFANSDSYVVMDHILSLQV